MRRSRILALGLALSVLGAALVSSVAWARPPTIYQLYLLVFGEPAALGTLVSATGASITNSTTGTPFVLTTTNVTYRVITISCDALAYVGTTATCGTTAATASGCLAIRPTSAPQVMILLDSTTAINAAGPAAFNCNLAQLK